MTSSFDQHFALPAPVTAAGGQEAGTSGGAPSSPPPLLLPSSSTLSLKTLSLSTNYRSVPAIIKVSWLSQFPGLDE